MYGSTKLQVLIIGPAVFYCKSLQPAMAAVAKPAITDGGAICRTAL
jgi:hypothetical protein